MPIFRAKKPCKLCRILDDNKELVTDIIKPYLNGKYTIGEVTNLLNGKGFKISYATVEQHMKYCLSYKDELRSKITRHALTINVNNNKDIIKGRLSVEKIIEGLEDLYNDVSSRYKAFTSAPDFKISNANLPTYSRLVNDVRQLSLDIVDLLNNKKLVDSVMSWIVITYADRLGKELRVLMADNKEIKNELTEAVVRSMHSTLLDARSRFGIQ
jgi:nucleoside diphosphate kinase